MPQMKPMNWLMLFMSLNFMLMIMNIMNYFFPFYKKNEKKMNFKNNIKFKSWNW